MVRRTLGGCPTPPAGTAAAAAGGPRDRDEAAESSAPPDDPQAEGGRPARLPGSPCCCGGGRCAADVGLDAPTEDWEAPAEETKLFCFGRIFSVGGRAAAELVIRSRIPMLPGPQVRADGCPECVKRGAMAVSPGGAVIPSPPCCGCWRGAVDAR